MHRRLRFDDLQRQIAAGFRRRLSDDGFFFGDGRLAGWQECWASQEGIESNKENWFKINPFYSFLSYQLGLLSHHRHTSRQLEPKGRLGWLLWSDRLHWCTQLLGMADFWSKKDDLTISRTNHQLFLTQGILNCLTESLGTVFGCLRISGKVAAATSNWWTLDAAELLQIHLLLLNDEVSTGIDVPVYLPVRSPRTPFRLVRWKLTQQSDVCVLCGPTPTLSDMEREVKRFWRTAFALIKSAESCYPVNVPGDVTLDPNILS